MCTAMRYDMAWCGSHRNMRGVRQGGSSGRPSGLFIRRSCEFVPTVSKSWTISQSIPLTFSSWVWSAAARRRFALGLLHGMECGGSTPLCTWFAAWFGVRRLDAALLFVSKVPEHLIECDRAFSEDTFLAGFCEGRRGCCICRDSRTKRRRAAALQKVSHLRSNFRHPLPFALCSCLSLTPFFSP